MQEFMNKPDEVPYMESDIVREYMVSRDIKSISKIYCIHTNTVKSILRKAGVLEEKQKRGRLHDIGMSEKDFYEEDI